MSWSAAQLRRRRYEALVSTHLDALLRSAHGLLREPHDAEDLVQEVFVRAYKNLDRIRDEAGIRAWLYRILRNAYIDRLRRMARAPTLVQWEDAEAVAELPPLPIHASAEAAADWEALCEREVVEAMNALPEELRTAFLFHALGGLSYHEVAVAMDCPLGTVMSRVHRARAHLREGLAAYAVERGIVRKPAATGENESEARHG